MRALVLAALLAALSGCGPSPEPAPKTGGEQPQVAAPAETTPPPPAQEERADANLPSRLPPPSSRRPRFVGLWATDARMCADPPWRFEAREISTQGEVHCDFESVREVSGGYDIQASCTAEAPPEPYQIRLTFAESARAMMIEGGPWSPGTSLIYCRGL